MKRFRHRFSIHCRSLVSEEITREEIENSVASICADWETWELTGGSIEQETENHRGPIHCAFHFDGICESTVPSLKYNIENDLAHFDVLIDSWQTSVISQGSHSQAGFSSGKNLLTPVSASSQQDTPSQTAKSFDWTLLADILPSYAGILLSKNMEEQKKAIDQEPQLLSRLLAQHALYTNKEFEKQINQQLKEIETAEKNLLDDVQKIYDELRHDFFKPSFKKITMIERAMDFDEAQFLHCSAMIIYLFKDQIPELENCKEDISAAVNEAIAKWSLLEELGDEHPSYDTVQNEWKNAMIRLRNYSNQIRTLLSRELPEEYKRVCDANGFVTDQFHRENSIHELDAHHYVYINDIDHELFLDTLGNFHTFKETTLLKKIEKEKNLVKDIKKEIQRHRNLEIDFSPQEPQTIVDSLSPKSRRHVLFADSVFQDGMFYLSKKPAYKSGKRIVYKAPRLQKSDILAMNSFPQLQSRWLDMPLPLRKKMQKVVGLTASGEIDLAQSAFSSQNERKVLLAEHGFWFGQHAFQKEKSREHAFQEYMNKIFEDWQGMLSDQDKENVQYQDFQKALTSFFEEVFEKEGVQHKTLIRKENSSQEVLQASGYLQSGLEEEFVKALKQNGAKLQPNQLALPTYVSWTQIRQGLGYRLEKDGVDITYIPKQLSEAGKKHIVRIDFQKNNKALLSKTEEIYLSPQHFRSPEQMFVVKDSQDRYSLVGPDMVLSGSEELLLKELQKEKGTITGSNLTLLFRDRRFQADKEYSIQPLQEHLRAKGETVEETMTYCDNWSSISSFRPWKDGFIKSGSYRQMEAIKEEMLQSHRPFVLECDSEEEQTFWRERVQTKNSDTLINRLLERDILSESFVEKYQVEAGVEQNAPKTERGRLFVNCQDWQQTEKVLTDLGILKEVHKEIPKNLLRGDVSKISVPHSEFLHEASPIVLPKNNFIIHGMTGVEDNLDEAEKRLHKILQLGGLLSIRTRRHYDLELETLSPVGDIASGIDHGVPATIGVRPVYGHEVFFVMKPSLLENRNIWFADTDYGGGHDRERYYDGYAKRIGQSSHYDPPSRQARENHIANLIEGQLDNDNEVFFEEGVALNEIAAVLVSADLMNRVEGPLLRAQAKGLFSKDTVFRTLHDTEYSAIQKVLTKLSGI